MNCAAFTEVSSGFTARNAHLKLALARMVATRGSP